MNKAKAAMKAIAAPAGDPGKLLMERSSGNVFADLGFDPAEALNLQMRSQLLIALGQWFESSGMTQAEAARKLHINQPRLNRILKGTISEFSLDSLVNAAQRAGLGVTLTLRKSRKLAA